MCIESFNELPLYEHINLIECKDWGGLVRPKEDVVLLCQIAEKEVSICEIENQLTKRNFYEILLEKCFKKINNKIFNSMYFDSKHECTCTKGFLVKSIIEMFLKIKLYHIGTKKTETTIQFKKTQI